MPAQITALPTPPSTNDPANFNTRADAFLGQMPTFVTQANVLATEVYGLAVQVTADKGSAAASAATATSSAWPAFLNAARTSVSPGPRITPVWMYWTGRNSFVLMGFSLVVECRL